MGTLNQLFVSAALASVCFASASAMQDSTATPASKGIAVRGCLKGSKLTHVEPVDPGAPFPDSLGVNGIRAIRTELKSLNGHQVELIGTVEGVGQQKGGILVNNSDKAKIYLGGGDPSLGEDFRRNVPAVIYANTVKNLAPTCDASTAPASAK